MLKSTNQGVNSQLNSGGSFLTEVDNQVGVYSDQKSKHNSIMIRNL